MLRSKRTFVVALSLALGVLAVAAVDAFDLMPGGPGEEAGVNTAAGRPKPRPTAGGSSREPEGGGRATDEVGVPSALRPSDTAVYVEVASLAEVARIVREIVGRFDPNAAMMFDGEAMIGQMLGAFGGNPADVDRGRPFGLALSIPDGGEPRPTLILPVRSPQGFQRGLQLPPGFAEPRREAGYVGLAMGSSYPVDRGATPPAFRFDAATVNARMDMAPLRAQIESGMEQMRRTGQQMARTLDPSTAAAYAYSQQLATEFMTGMDHVELAIDLADERFGIEMGVGLSPESSWARSSVEEPADLAALARFAHPTDDIVALAGWDRAFLEEVVRPFVDQLGGLPSSASPGIPHEQIAAVMSFLPSFGEQLGVFVSLDPGAAHLAFVGRPADADALLGMAGMALAGVDRSVLPVEVGSLQEVELEDGRAARLTIDLGVAPAGEPPFGARVRRMLTLLFGGDEVELRLATRDGWMIATLGADPEWRDGLFAAAAAGTDPGTPRPGLEELLRKVDGASPAAAYQADLLELQRNLMTLMAEQMELDPEEELARLEETLGSEPFDISAYGAVRGELWSSGTDFDLGRMMRMAEMMQ